MDKGRYGIARRFFVGGARCYEQSVSCSSIEQARKILREKRRYARAAHNEGWTGTIAEYAIVPVVDGIWVYGVEYKEVGSDG